MTENNDDAVENVGADSASWEYWKNGELVASGDLCDHPCDEYLKGESCKCNDLSVMLGETNVIA